MTTESDPFRYCAAVDTAHWPAYEDSTIPQYAGDPTPFRLDMGMVTQRLVWRCWDGRVLVCNPGDSASGFPCLMANTASEPWPELVSWCRENPGVYPPMAVTGHMPLYWWTCDGAGPVIESRALDPADLDAFGFLFGVWFEARQTPTGFEILP